MARAQSRRVLVGMAFALRSATALGSNATANFSASATGRTQLPPSSLPASSHGLQSQNGSQPLAGCPSQSS